MTDSVPLDERIARRVAADPDSPALVAADGMLTYRELWEHSGAARYGLPGTGRVAVSPISDVGSVIVVVAAIRAGRSVLLLHRHVPADHLREVLRLGGCDHVVASSRVHARLRRLGVSGPITTPDDVVALGTRTRASQEFAPPEDAELLAGLTSGTSGRPKLFVRDRRSWSRTLDRSDEEFTVDHRSTVAAPGVLDHTHFLYGVLHGLTRGATVDVRPLSAWPASGFSPTHVYTVPTIAHDLVHGRATVPPSIREVLSSGAFWPDAARRALIAAVPGVTTAHYYGASELSMVALGVSTENPPPDSAGRLVSGVDVDVRDGIVHVRSDMLFDGYLDRGTVRDGPENGWMSVGDRGLVRDGWLFLAGRRSETIVRGGLNVEPTDVERALLEFPGIDDAACAGAPDPRMGHVPVAAVVASAPPDWSALRRHLRARLDVAAVPTHISIVDRLPRTARGKLDRPAVVDLVVDRALP